MTDHLPIYSTKLFGHKKIIDFFHQAVQKNKLSKAYLFCGPKGIGKETFAIHLTRFLHSNYKDITHFGITSVTDKLYISMCNNTLDNFLYIKKDQILIEDSKSINDFIHKKTLKTKIIIIDSIENISIQAANAMLKSIEDSENVIFFIITSDETRVLPTIKSRCIKIPFRDLDQHITKLAISYITGHSINENIFKITNTSIGTYIDLIKIQFDTLYENIIDNFFSLSISIDSLQKNNIYYTVLIIQSILILILKNDLSVIPEKYHYKFNNISNESITDTYFAISSVYTDFIKYKLDSEMILYEIYSYIRKLFL